MPRRPARRPEQAARGWASRLDMPEVLRQLDQPGCVLCRIRDGGDEAWLRWFVIETHNQPPALSPMPTACSPRSQRTVPAALIARWREPYSLGLSPVSENY
jgi:hypothetical protein